MTPTARHEGILTQEVGEELIVFDTATQQAHRLNGPAALVFQHCDGHTSLAQLAELVGDAGSVELALAQLQGAGLLASPAVARRSRTKALLTPVVETLLAPTPAAAVTF